MLPLLATLTGVGAGGTPEVDRLDATGAQGQLLETTVSELFARLHATPTVWIFEDVQFMDVSSTDLLDRLVEDAHDRPWLIIATRRPDAEWRPPKLSHRVDLPLEPLTTSAADDLLSSAAAGAGLPPHRVAALVERADGNPLFLTELAAGLGALTDDAELPDSVEGMMATRIDRLSPADRSLLRTAAVLGMTPQPELLDAVVRKVDHGRVHARSARRALAEFLAQQPDGSYRFTHHLVRETAYEGLPFRRRVRLHATAADVIADHPVTDTNRINLLSLHCLLGERYAEAYALSMQAGLHAVGQFANAEAAECYERVLRAARTCRTWSHATWAWSGSRWPRSTTTSATSIAMADALEQARRRLRDDPLALGRLTVLTAVHRRLTGRHTEAMRWVTRGRRLLEGDDRPEALRLRAVLAERYAQSLLSKGRVPRGHQLGRHRHPRGAGGRRRAHPGSGHGDPGGRP